MDRKLNIAIPLLLFLFITMLLPSFPGLGMDNDCWKDWALYIHNNGLRNAYGSKTDYMPVYQYFLWLYSMAAGSGKSISAYIPYLRCITLAFEFLGIWYVYKWIDKKLAYFAIIAICILNISYTYNTIIWGQLDGILSAMIFISLYYAWKGANLWSAIWLVLAINFKMQALIILPVWGLLFFNNFLNSRKIRDILIPVSVAIVLQVVIFIPFISDKYSLSTVLDILTHSLNRNNAISVKAPNVWHLITSGTTEDLMYGDDSSVWIAGLSYKTAGFILFFTTSFFALLPLLKLTVKNLRTTHKKIVVKRELVWATAAMVYLLFYFFNTEIHERYCHPAFIFITAYAFYTGDFIVYILFSIAYFLTLEVTMHQMRLQNYDTVIFNMRFLAVMHAFILVYFSVKIRKYYKLNCLQQ